MWLLWVPVPADFCICQDWGFAWPNYFPATFAQPVPKAMSATARLTTITAFRNTKSIVSLTTENAEPRAGDNQRIVLCFECPFVNLWKRLEGNMKERNLQELASMSEAITKRGKHSLLAWLAASRISWLIFISCFKKSAEHAVHPCALWNAECTRWTMWTHMHLWRCQPASVFGLLAVVWKGWSRDVTLPRCALFLFSKCFFKDSSLYCISISWENR